MRDDDVLAPRALPAQWTVAPASYAGAPVAADAILPFRPSGRNEPYALQLASPAWSLVVAGDPLNRVQVAAQRLHASRDPRRARHPRGRAGRGNARRRAVGRWRDPAEAAHAGPLGRAEPPRRSAARIAVAGPGLARRRCSPGGRALRLARERLGHAQSGVPQDRHRRRRCRRSRTTCSRGSPGISGKPAER